MKHLKVQEILMCLPLLYTWVESCHNRMGWSSYRWEPITQQKSMLNDFITQSCIQYRGICRDGLPFCCGFSVSQNELNCKLWFCDHRVLTLVCLFFVGFSSIAVEFESFAIVRYRLFVYQIVRESKDIWWHSCISRFHLHTPLTYMYHDTHCMSQ